MMVTDNNCEYLGLSRLCLMESAGKSLAEEVGKIAVYTFSFWQCPVICGIIVPRPGIEPGSHQ